MELLKNTLDEVMRGISRKKNDPSGEDPQQWLKKVLTKKELQHIKVKYFHKGTLGLNVDSSTWLYALSLKKEALLGELKQGNPKIKNLSLRIGETQ
ncbi:MAG: hypothetical protein COV71_05215 [Candidatus Omnitrophica bacterium CG11_big_fil_rev_8_21_14_0_20_41_12]|nr:MAG: hypothetical protein COV71_05215 [Candidatus Omnitrophica bacterium CG11_big_fil_rev_8_21_14_0_20_41_12]